MGFLKRTALPDIKKAQAAMEFLMTYGWALLVVLVAVGALAYFGVTNPGKFAPDQCLLVPGLSCISSYATVNVGAPDPISLKIQNGFGYSMDDFTATLDIQGVVLAPATADCTTPPGITLSPGQAITCGYALPVGKQAGDQIKGVLTMQWTDNQGDVRTRTGNIVLTIES